MSEAPAAVQVILYKLPPRWGLSSLSVACVEVEAYLRLAKVHFAVQECSSPSASPTGQVPALDTSADLVGADGVAPASAPLGEWAAARIMVDYLRSKVVDLDRGLTAAQRAEAAAFAALVEAKLRPALAHTTWCEAAAFAQHTASAYGADLPFPLSYFVPRMQRKAVARHFAGLSSSQVYQGAADALDALASRLGSSGGDFFFGPRPTSLDAALYSCLAFLHAAPVVHPQLQRKLSGHRVLMAYVERVSQLAFSASVPAAADAQLDWSAWEQGAADDQFSKARSEKEVELQRKGRRWLLCAAAAIGAYIYLSGQYQLNLLSGLGYELVDDEGDEDE